MIPSHHSSSILSSWFKFQFAFVIPLQVTFRQQQQKKRFLLKPLSLSFLLLSLFLFLSSFLGIFVSLFLFPCLGLQHLARTPSRIMTTDPFWRTRRLLPAAARAHRDSIGPWIFRAEKAKGVDRSSTVIAKEPEGSFLLQSLSLSPSQSQSVNYVLHRTPNDRHLPFSHTTTTTTL